MPVLDKTNKEEVEQYNKFVRSREHTSALQDLNWGKVKEGEWKCEAVYLEQNGNITAANKLTNLFIILLIINSINNLF